LRSDPEDDLAMLDVMIEALDKVARYTGDVSREEFLDSTLVQDAVALNFLVVGECANTLSEATKAKGRTAPWPQIISLRHRIAHRYQSVDRLTIFGLAIDDAADLRAALAELRTVIGTED
tara:strand:+ start:428 stop:787 length:360 start_codon:yes stop_codon:yes gene_type:complete